MQRNGKFRCTLSKDNFLAFRKKVKSVVNKANYGAKAKAEKLTPIVRGWRHYHRFCRMNGVRYSLSHLRHSKLYNGKTSQALKKQNHACARCGLKLMSDEPIHLHHIDRNHHNWKPSNLEAIHESRYDYIPMSKSES